MQKVNQITQKAEKQETVGITRQNIMKGIKKLKRKK